MKAHYGYADGSGEYYLIVDTDRCDGCGACAAACPEQIIEIRTDDYDEPKAMVRAAFTRNLGSVCPGDGSCGVHRRSCRDVCRKSALTLSW